MRFTALLLLAALAGTLVCAQDATADPTQAADNPESTQSDAPQETTVAAQETSEAAQESTEEQEENLLKSVIKKGIWNIKQDIEEAKNRLNENIEDVQEALKDEIDRLRLKLGPRRFFFS